MKLIEPLAFVERAEVTDPEGTAFGYDLKESEAQAWAAGVYQQGHLYMFPAQATGRFPYSSRRISGDDQQVRARRPAGSFGRDRIDDEPRGDASARRGDREERAHFRGEGRRAVWRRHAPAAAISRHAGHAMAPSREEGLLVALRGRDGHQPEVFQASDRGARRHQSLRAQRRRRHPLGVRIGSRDGTRQDRRVVGAEQGILGEERRCRWAIRCTITICCPPCR